MLIATFVLAFALGASAWEAPPRLPQCSTETKHITVTNTWGNIDLTTITSTEVAHDHTVLEVTNTVIIPHTTISTLTLTHFSQVPAVTTVSTVRQTNIHPVVETITHTALTTWSTQIYETETQVETQSVIKTVIVPTTTTLTTDRFVSSIVASPQVNPDVTVVTKWERATVQDPVYITWSNFRTTTVYDTVFMTKGLKSGHIATTVTEYDTVTRRCN